MAVIDTLDLARDLIAGGDALTANNTVAILVGG